MEGSQTTSTPPGSDSICEVTPGLGDPGLMSVTPSGVEDKPTLAKGLSPGILSMPGSFQHQLLIRVSLRLVIFLDS
ncbi:hypothetical protein BH10PLA2_BH10PLA2_28590 [soil metagenome]